MTRNRILLAGALAALAAAAAAWRWHGAGKDGAFRYETAAVDRGRIVARVTATGTLSALVTVQVGSQVSGSIASLNADYNSRVKKGQVIARIDPQLFQASVAQARANVVAAQGNLVKARAQAADAKRQLRRTGELAERKLVAQADLDTAQANADGADASVQSAEGSLAQARAALGSAQVNLAYATIVSPTDGVVISRNVDVGQTVAASLSAPTLFVIAEDLAKMQVDTSVAEADVGRLADRMPSSFTVDAFPGEEFRGTIRQVRNAAQTVQNVVTYDAVVDVPNPALKLRPGMTATVTFVYAQKDDALRVPNAALRFRPPPGMVEAGARHGARAAGPAREGGAAKAGADAGPLAGAGAVKRAAWAAGRQADEADADASSRVVWVLRDGRPVPVRVRPGISDGTVTEVVGGGLSPGDAVITDASGPAGARAPAAGAPSGMRRGLF